MLIDIILTPITRDICGGPIFIRQTAAGIYLMLQQQGQNVRFFDLILDEQSYANARPDEADVYCFPVFFANKVSAFKHIEKLRNSGKNSLIIVYGPFASEFPGQILAKGLADAVVHGDPEFVIPEVISGKDRSGWPGIPNLSFIKDGKLVQTRKDTSNDLDAIPHVSPFLYSQHRQRAYMVTTRGCRRHCVFCDRNAIWNNGGIRHRSVKNVIDEVKDLVEHHKVKTVEFMDEDFPIDHNRLIKLCAGLREIEAEFEWTCSACVDSVNKEMLHLMASSGCREIYFGVESASPRVLRKLGKTYGPQEILNAVRWSREAGLRVEVMVTTGNPGQTQKDHDLTLAFLKKIDEEVYAWTNRVVILPGTPLYRKGLKEGIFTEDYFFEDEGYIFYDKEDYGIKSGKKRILILGAGALGKSLGALLAGQSEILLYERDTPTRELMLREGFVFREDHEQKRMRVRVLKSLEEVRDQDIDVLIIATKVFDIRKAVDEAADLKLNPKHIFLPQNGNFDFSWIKKYFKDAKVCRGVTTMACQESEFNMTKMFYRGHFYLSGEGSQSVADALHKAGLKTAIFDNSEGVVWAKLIFSAVMNPLPVITGRGYESLQDKDVWRLVQDAVHEGHSVAQALNVKPAFDPMSVINRVREGDLNGIEHKGSIIHDVSAGRNSELEYITGEVIKEARKNNISTPALDSIFAKAKAAGA